MLDLPHTIVKGFIYLKSKITHRRYVDTFYFDLGYYQAHSWTIFTFGMLFATIIPLTTLFTCLFFTLKYFIEKYNTIFVY